MKNKVFIVFLALTLVALPLFSACAAPAPPAAIELGLALIWPATHDVATKQFPDYIKMVEEAAKGKYTIKLNLFPPGTLLGGAEIYDGVTKGVCDMGSSCFAYTPGRFPFMEAVELPAVVYNTAQVAAPVVWEFYKKFKPAEVSGLKLLYLFSTGPGWLLTKSPVRTLDDLQGLEIRATGLSAKSLEALGAVPVAMPQSEVYPSLQKGIVKGNLAPLEVLKGFKQAEITDYVTTTPFLYNTAFFMIMNLDKWNSLPKDLQDAFDKVADDANKAGGQLWTDIQKDGMDFAVETTGQQMIYLSDEEMAKWIAILKPIQDKYVADMAAKGLPGKEALDFVLKESTKYNKEYPLLKY